MLGGLQRPSAGKGAAASGGAAAKGVGGDGERGGVGAVKHPHQRRRGRVGLDHVTKTPPASRNCHYCHSGPR